MKKKTYRAIIDNDGHISTMIVGGVSKKSVTKELTDFFIKLCDNDNCDFSS